MQFIGRKPLIIKSHKECSIWEKEKLPTKISVEVLEIISVRLAFVEVSNYREPMFREGRMPHQKRQDLSLPE